MFVDLLLIILLSTVCTKALEDELSCPCDTDEDRKDKQLFWDWLKKRDADEDLTVEEKAIWPGMLHQFDCRPCNEVDRKNSGIINQIEFEEAKRLAAIKKKTEEQATEEPIEENDKNCVCAEETDDMRCPINMCWNVIAKKCAVETDCLRVRH